MMRSVIRGLEPVAFCGFLFFGSLVQAQPRPNLRPADPTIRKLEPSKKSAIKTTTIEVELLQGAEGGGLYAQQWLKVLEPLNVSLRIHRSVTGDKPDLKERESGTTRSITAIGTLDKSGTISFPGRKFALSDAAKVKEWIEELRAYGIQGSPQGQPLWGLTKEQFGRVYDALLKTVQSETADLPLSEVVAALPLPNQYPIRWSDEAKAAVARRGDRNRVRQELKGLSIGTVLAVALGEQGLAYRPNRTPAGEVELLIEPRNPKTEQWPIGWELQNQSFKAAPKLYAMVPVELSDVELSDVLNAISQLSETPILIDYAELDAKQIKLEKIKVSFPLKKTTWTIALRQLLAPQKLVREIWQDEAGHVFVWVTSVRAGRAKETDKPEQ
jgi:hypothetical protein